MENIELHHEFLLGLYGEVVMRCNLKQLPVIYRSPVPARIDSTPEDAIDGFVDILAEELLSTSNSFS